MLHGAWTYTWQGTKEEYFSKSASNVITALKKKADVVLFDHKRILEKKADEKMPLMPKVDAMVICIGEDAYAETPGNIKDLELDRDQQMLVKKLAEAGTPIILVLLEGRPRIIREIEPLAEAVIFAGWPGSQGAEAIADVICGDYNPDGKLPFTYPRYSNELLTYDHKPLDIAVEEVSPEYKYSFSFNPQWEFGHGLSYTSFEYSDLVISPGNFKGDEEVKITVKVKNTGSRAGKEVVELYSRDVYASVTPSVKRLRAFEKISLQPGETKTVEFKISASDLAFVNEQLKWITEKGEFEIIIKNLKGMLMYE
jgi:beta-glucosidase